MKSDDSDTPSIVKLRHVLLNIVGLFDPKDAKVHREESAEELIDRASACDAPPSTVERILRSDPGSGGSIFEDEETVRNLTAACESWYGVLVKNVPSTHLPRDRVLAPVPVRENKVKRRAPQVAELPWDEVVSSVRAELLGFPACGLGVIWQMPRKVWSSRWVEAYRVTSFADGGERRGLALLPTVDAAKSREARAWWKLKIDAAAKFVMQGRPDSRMATVIDHADPINPGYVLLEFSPPCGSLHEYVTPAQLRTLRDEIEAALAWCDLLSSLGRRGIYVVDLAPSLLNQSWSESQRTIYLADPTAVLPPDHILPEFRVGVSLPSAARYREAACDQVFVVGALLLSCIRRDLGCLQQGISACGPSASLASLAGLPALSNRAAAELLPSVQALLEQHSRPDRVDVTALAHALQWSLTESSSGRYTTLQKLAGDLRRCLL